MLKMKRAKEVGAEVHTILAGGRTQTKRCQGVRAPYMAIVVGFE